MPPPDPTQLELRLAASTPTPKGYQQTYALRGPAGATLIQQVETLVDFGPAEAPLLSYRGCYAEYFLLGREGQALDDLHEFDLHRDGWEQAKIRDELKRAGVRGPDGRRVRFDRAPRLRMRKRFLLSLGEVQGVEVALKNDSGAAFGFLSQGPGGDSSAERIFAPPGGERWSEPAHPVATGYEAHGQGHFTAAQGWRLEESYVYDFATRSYTFEGGGGYRLTPLDSRERGRG